ncbi:spore germination protein GerPC [Tenuibacillus multivorans]|uniref:Spore germination protein PC n=1 Tax=Tenuibacillus multivorans TaxID=237069 RepID=A0A1H0A1I4_9BACI|nr:spore germination protein GerPC [Tenuibacillus multivorans]GEL78349.1 putative spore germination protein GerPC [Tenuibacillus multivorans]SDN27031.1 spore germination protein PC [Tenuibacillus multivorans]
MDDHNTVWQHLAYLEQKINQQTSLINELNQKIDRIMEQQNQASNSSVERVEYNFEQLKIETLEGTLNIGLTPQQDLPFEQMDLPKENTNEPTITPMEQQIFNQLQPYINKDVPQIIDQFAAEQDMNVSQEWKTVLVQDIKKQLPNRIKEHTSKMQQDGRVIVDRDQVPMLINHIKKEISQGIHMYLNKVKENNDGS